MKKYSSLSSFHILLLCTGVEIVQVYFKCTEFGIQCAWHHRRAEIALSVRPWGVSFPLSEYPGGGWLPAGYWFRF